MIGKIQKRLERFGSLSKLAIDIGYLTQVRKAPPKEVGQYTKQRLTKLGPTFIKIGQFISTRADIFGNDFVDELKGLQDKIDRFDVDITDIEVKKGIIIDTYPIATASIGQVYRGKLQSGEEVAVKVKRPYIEQTITSDFDTFMMVLKMVNLVSNERESMELSIVINEYYKLLQEEINFHEEVQNIMMFKMMFKNKNFVKIPDVYQSYCDNEVIVMEYVPSIRIDDIYTLRKMNFNTSKIAKKLMEVFLDQIIVNGVIHIDPHPGNVGITNNGKIVFYDYGMIQKIGIDFKKDLKNILLAVYNKDVDYLCELLVSSEIVIIEKDMMPYLKNFVVVLIEYIDNLDIDRFKLNYIDKIDNTELPFKLSSKFLLILRGLSILEGVCKTLDPEFNYRQIIEEYIDKNTGMSFTDVNYIEKKAIIDITNVRAIPNRLTQNELQIQLLEKNISKMRSKPDKLYLLAILLICFDTVENIYVKFALFCITFISLYK